MSLSYNSPVNFNHRITGIETEELEITEMTLLQLADTIDRMTDRATATANLLIPYYNHTTEDEIDTRTMHFALKSIALELADIQKTVEAYAMANK